MYSSIFLTRNSVRQERYAQPSKSYFPQTIYYLDTPELSLTEAAVQVGQEVTERGTLTGE